MTFLTIDEFAARTLPVLDEIAARGDSDLLLKMVTSCPPEGLRSLTLGSISRLSPGEGYFPSEDNPINDMFEELVAYNHRINGGNALDAAAGEFGINFLIDRVGTVAERVLLITGLVRYFAATQAPKSVAN